MIGNMLMKALRLLAALLFAAGSSCAQAASAPSCSPDPALTFPGQAWSRQEPAQAGWSVAELQAAKEYAKSIGTTAWLLVEDGKIIDSYGPIERLNSLHSARKSVMSALYGQAVADGTIDLSKTLEQLGIDDNEPKLTADEKRATLRDLLMARSGVYHEALGESPAMKAARPQSGSHPHGAFWYYNNWDFNVLGTVFNQSTRMSLFEFFNARIAVPLHMEDYKVSNQSYLDGPESIHKYYNFEMSARDLARFGLLFLSQGCWEGRQIIPSAWVKESTAPYSDTVSNFLPNGMGYYGYLWWIANGGRLLPNATIPDGSYAALGVGPQVALVIPSRKIVLVHRVATDNQDNPSLIPMGKVGTLIEMILQAKR
jgi:CubicO group peptidase (beta-lactamase class C family)